MEGKQGRNMEAMGKGRVKDPPLHAYTIKVGHEPIPTCLYG
jgi:hypothetical protein